MEQLCFDNRIVSENERIKSAIENVINDFEYSKFLSVSNNLDNSISIKANNTIVAKLRLRKKGSSYMEIRVRSARFFDPALVKDLDEEWSKVEFNEIDDVIAFAESLVKLYMNILMSIEKKAFGCCHRYIKCSDAMQCLHPNKIEAEACQYKKNLDKGNVFYGKNKNN